MPNECPILLDGINGRRLLVAVAVGGPETPADVTRAADIVVDGPDGMLQLLHQIAFGYP